MASSSQASKQDFQSFRSQVLSLEARIQQATTKDEALQCAIDAAELCLRAVKSAASKSDKAEMRVKAQVLLDKAERLKKMKATDYKSPAPTHKPSSMPGSWLGNGSATSVSNAQSDSTLIPRMERPPKQYPALKRKTAPQSKRALSNAEQILLLNGGKLNGFKFRPWGGGIPKSTDFFLENGAQPYEDSDGLRLSRQQLEFFAGWKRAVDAIPPPSWHSGDRSLLAPTMKCTLPMDLVQDATTDCSVVASLCAGAARAQKGHPKLLSDVIYPWDEKEETPLISPNGKYIVKLNFNGCYRRVEIDDRLPVSKNKRMLHVIDRKNPTLLWPALLEKAYLKVRGGGYDFPGSNSSTDLWILMGWIPEQVFLQDADTDLSRVWGRMLEGWNEGDVLVTMGTGSISPRAERELGLAAQHDYAVLDLKEENGYQLVLMKNPWIDGKSWTGRRIGPDSPQPSSVDLLSDNVARTSISSQSQKELPSGTFWIPWNDVHQHFESIYLNWNPCLFSYREDIHFSWDPQDKRSATGSFANNPQFAVLSKGIGTLWLLLCRHFQDATSASGREAANINVDSSGTMPGHMSLYVYDCNGERISISSPPLKRGPYVDAPQILLRLEMRKATTYTAVVSEQGLPNVKQSFSLNAFSTMPVELSQARDRFPYSSTISSGWTSSSSGGSGDTLLYFTNPQFVLELPAQSDLAVLLETPDDELNVHFKLVHSAGERVDGLANRDIIADSGVYRLGSAYVEVRDLCSGKYTIICSTFEPNQRAKFVLRVDGSAQPGLRRLPSEFAGRISKVLQPAEFKTDFNRLGAQLIPLRNCKFSAAVTYQTSTLVDYRSPVRLAVEINHGLEKKIFCQSNEGEYADCKSSSVRLQEMNIWPQRTGPGEYLEMWLTVERMGGAVEVPDREEFQITITTDGKVEERVEVGKWKRWDD